jgi:hypothetical protein
MKGFQETKMIGENHHGYGFGVGLAGGRWIGFAAAVIKGTKALFFLPGQANPDMTLGSPDADAAMRLTVAIAEAPEHGYGGIDKWLLPNGGKILVDPDEFRCPDCGEIGCNEH